MAECYRTGPLHLHHHISRHMAAGTVPQGKCLFPLMAGAARFPFFHPGHGYGRVSAGLEEAGVATAATEFPGVGPMDEDDIPGWLDNEGHIPDLMAATAGGKGKGDPAVTRPARFPFFHLGHGYGPLAFLLV